MLKLFHTIFSRYGKVGKYPKFTLVSGYHWCAYCDLDQSFAFLLKKVDVIPKWIFQRDDLFFAFLAGYFDAEGCIYVDARPRGHTVSWIVQSCDYQILRAISHRLKTLGFKAGVRLAKSKDGARWPRSLWSVRVGKRDEVAKLLDRVRLRHPEKTARVGIVNLLRRNSWRAGWHRVEQLRARIKNEVLICRSSARDKLSRPSHVS